MPWLVSDARVLASTEVTSTRAERRKGLLGRTGLSGAMVIRPCRCVHTIGMKFPIDVAYVDADGRVIKTLHMRRNRIGFPVWRARSVIEAEMGAFERWGLGIGDTIEIRAQESSL